MHKNPSTAESRLEITVPVRNLRELLLNSGFFAAHAVSMHIHCESLPQQPIGDLVLVTQLKAPLKVTQNHGVQQHGYHGPARYEGAYSIPCRS